MFGVVRVMTTKKDIIVDYTDLPSYSPGVPLDGKHLPFPRQEELQTLFPTTTSKAAQGLTYAAFVGLGTKGEHDRHYVLNMTKELAPRDAYEGMVVTQILLAHRGFVDAMGQMWDARDEQSCEAYSRVALRCSQTMNIQVNKLRRYRLGSQAKISFNQVMVRDGGKAIVGTVRTEHY